MTTGWFGENWGFLIHTAILWTQAIILLVSAVAAIYLIYQNSRQARIELLITQVNQQKANQDLQKTIQSVNALFRKGPSLPEPFGKIDSVSLAFGKSLKKKAVRKLSKEEIKEYIRNCAKNNDSPEHKKIKRVLFGRRG